MCRMEFSKITNKIFYGLNDEENESLINQMSKDGSIIMICHSLYLNTNRKFKANVTIDLLLEECGYKLDKDNRSKVKFILEGLKQYGIIEYTEIKKANDMIIIDTTNLVDEGGFTILETKEIDLISNETKDIREFMNILKVYLYLKARCFKREGHTNIDIVGGRAETTFCSYENIVKMTKVTESNINKYIDILSKIGLIKYSNNGLKYKGDKIYTNECANVYAFPMMSKNVESELKEGLKQQKHFYEVNGYTITKKKYLNNDKKLNGKKGALMKKKYNDTITENERLELERIIAETENNIA